MFVGRVELTEFRNYKSESVELVPGVNAVVGRNGQGKTNILEAIHLLAVLSSHRTSLLAPLVMHGSDRAVVRGKAEARSRSVAIDLEIRPGSGIRARVNKVSMERGGIGNAGIAAVIFSPDDLQLVKGGPESRRRFMDAVAAGLRFLAATERLEFDRVNRQRNGALKAAQVNPRARDSLDVWDEQFVMAAIPVILARMGVVRGLKDRVVAHYRRLAGSGAPDVSYSADWSDGELAEDADKLFDALSRAIVEARAREIERGSSLVGPQRDDLELTLEGVELKVFGSQGEQRTLALALRLAERDMITEARGEDPILLLDDVFSELDDSRRERLGELVSHSTQTIATATTLVGIPVETSKVLTIEGGRAN